MNHRLNPPPTLPVSEEEINSGVESLHTEDLLQFRKGSGRSPCVAGCQNWLLPACFYRLRLGH